MDARISKLKDRMVADQVRMNRLMFEAIDVEFKHTLLHDKPVEVKIKHLTEIADMAAEACDEVEKQSGTMALHYRICSGEVKKEDLTTEQVSALSRLIIEELIPGIRAVNIMDLASGKVSLKDLMR